LYRAQLQVELSLTYCIQTSTIVWITYICISEKKKTTWILLSVNNQLNTLVSQTDQVDHRVNARSCMYVHT